MNEQEIADILLRLQNLETRISILEEENKVGGIYTEGVPQYIKDHLNLLKKIQGEK